MLLLLLLLLSAKSRLHASAWVDSNARALVICLLHAFLKGIVERRDVHACIAVLRKLLHGRVCVCVCVCVCMCRSDRQLDLHMDVCMPIKIQMFTAQRPRLDQGSS